MKEIARIRTSLREEGLYKIVTIEWEEDGFPCFCDLRVSGRLKLDEYNLDEVAYERLSQLMGFVDVDAFDDFIDVDRDSLS